MAKQAYILFIGDAPWHIGCVRDHQVSLTQVPTQENPLEALVQTLREAGYQGQSVAIGLPSSWCLSGTINTQGLPRQKARQAMLYRFEEKLPLALEEVTSDLIANNGHALCIATQTRRVQSIVEALEQHGIAVDLIWPQAMFALQHALDQNKELDCDWYVLQQPAHYDVFHVVDKQPMTWHVVHGDVNNLLSYLRVRSVVQDKPLRVGLHADDHTATSLRNIDNLQIIDTVTTPPVHESAALAAARALTTKRMAWGNLRRDRLGAQDPLRQLRRPINAAVCCVLLLVAVACGVMYWRGLSFKQLSDEHVTQQAALFRETFPGQRVPPVDIRSRLESEAKRLAGMAGQTSDMPARVSALTHLHELLTRLPTDLRYRVLETRIDEKQLYLEGHARSHGDVDQVISSLRKYQGFALDPPRTEKLKDKGVAFTVTGTMTTHPRNPQNPRTPRGAATP